jgi:hypothetical protein
MIRATQDYFHGRWLLVRIIENVPEGVIGEVWGEADFIEDAKGLTCREQGVMRFRGTDWHTERTSLWRFPEPGRVEVRYADGRPFHDFLTREPIALAIEQDARYEIVYEFEPDTWISRWQMLGPAANYMMTTRYRR